MRRLLAVLAAALTAAPAGATPWHVMGPRAMGMGGAHVAIAQGPLATYWNPAGLGQLYNTSGFELAFGARGAFAGDVLQGANDLHKIAETCRNSGPGGICNSADISTALGRLGQPGNGALLDAGGGAALKVKKVTVFVHNVLYAGATPEPDMVNTGACSGAGCIDQNQSKLIVRGGNFTEFGVGYGRELGQTGLVLGGNLKGIVGRIGYGEQTVSAEDPELGGFGDLHDNSKASFQPGVDLGLLWDMRETFISLPMRPRLALVGRNLNNPKFEQPDAAKNAGDRDKYSLQGQARAGAALSPFSFWHLAADLDLTDNVTPLDGQRSRFFSLGTEVNVFNRTWLNIPVRAGLQKNVSKQANSAWAYAAGFGLNFLHLMVDVGAQVSSQRTQVQSAGEDKKIPDNVALSARVAFLFGGADEGGRNK